MNAVLQNTPFAQLTKVATTRKHKPMHAVDVDMLKLEHDTPLPDSRRILGKYDDLFSKMRFGSCIACEPKEKENIANGLRKYLQRMKKPGKIVSVKNCEDGKSRIWLVKE